jgi:hypothetical protein
MSGWKLLTLLAALLGGLAALLAGCAPAASPYALPLAGDRPTLLFVYTDG